jgi:hypothetical protein
VLVMQLLILQLGMAARAEHPWGRLAGGNPVLRPNNPARPWYGIVP